MAARDTLNHSSTYRENQQEEHASEAKHLQYAVENQEDWSRSDPGIRFTDELKKISDKAATAFDNGESLAHYSDEDLDHIVDSYLTAWSKLEFASDTDRRNAANDLAHKVFEPMASQEEYKQGHLDQRAVDSLPETERNQVKYLLNQDQADEYQKLTGHTLEPLNTQAIHEAHSQDHLIAKQDLATMAYAEINSNRETFANTLYNYSASNYQETAQTLRMLVGNAVTRYKTMSEEDTSAGHASEYHRNLYIDISTPAGWTSTQNTIANIYEHDPVTARAATKVIEKIMEGYMPEMKKALEDHDDTRFKELRDNVIKLDTSLANTLKADEGFITGEDYNQPELPGTFPDFETAMNYIKEVNAIIAQLDNNKLDAMTTYKMALSSMSEDFTANLHIIEEVAKSNNYSDPTYLGAIHRTAENIDFLLRPKDADPTAADHAEQSNEQTQTASAAR